ncbi:aminoglycoside 3-N-acetyltransferase [Maridesulfovibrio ferrireducens]|uniref:Aminoglycoside N(3)-acetyltransferase n=1 Tax=Maridesulfovibrio ferrireducens TaxID=246191 RepID=A0A1G9CLJ3_9BACT|nr:AAC(3) family N-acetyltransferase [Maridesulfovibrio ferrireducens]SDK52466.1 aminoglycoside 3-N-acetyltransferase [Maridesulfovibrio ferrireducens]
MLKKTYQYLFMLAYRYYGPLRKRKASMMMKSKQSSGFNLPVDVGGISNRKLFQALERAGVQAGGTLFIRTSLSAASAFEGGVVGYLNALKEYLTPSGNLVMSSYTFSKSPLMTLADNPLFAPESSIDQLNLVSEFFRRQSDVYRSIHPTHSVSAWGKDAQWITKDHHTSSFCYAEVSPFAKLYALDANEVSIGVFPTSLSYHYIEQYLPVGQPGFRDLPCPVMCRIVVDGNERTMPFNVTDTFTSILRISETFEGTNAEPISYKISDNLDMYIHNLNKQLGALKDIVKEKGSIHYVTSPCKDLFLRKIIKPMVLNAVFNKKDGVLYPVKEPSK